MTKFEQQRLKSHQPIFTENGYELIKFSSLLCLSFAYIVSIAIVDNDENSVTKHFVKNFYTFCLYLLRIVAKNLSSNHIRLKLNKTSIQFEGKVEINGQIRNIKCYRPKFDDFILTIDNNPIINLLYKFPKGFNFIIFSEHSESSSSNRANVFSKQLDPLIKQSLFKISNFQSVSNLIKTVNRQIDGTFEKIVDTRIESFSDVLMAISRIFQNLGLAFIKESDYPSDLTTPINIEGTNYILIAYSLKSGCYKPVDQSNTYLNKLLWLLKGKNLDSVDVTPDEVYVKNSKNELSNLNSNFDLNELFKTQTNPEIKTLNIDFELFYKSSNEDVSYGLSEKAVKELFNVGLSNFVDNSRITSRNENLIDKYKRVNVDGIKFIANKHSNSIVEIPDTIDYDKLLNNNDERILKDYIFKFKDEILFKDVLNTYKERFELYFLNDWFTFGGVSVQDLINLLKQVEINDTSEDAPIEDLEEDSEVECEDEEEEIVTSTPKFEFNTLKEKLTIFNKELQDFFKAKPKTTLEWSEEKNNWLTKEVLRNYTNQHPQCFDEELLRRIISFCLCYKITDYKYFVRASNFDVLNELCIKKFDFNVLEYNPTLGHTLDNDVKTLLIETFDITFKTYKDKIPQQVFNLCLQNFKCDGEK